MGETGRRFKRAFQTTPTQAQVMLDDPFAKDPPQRTVWYQSRFYRANLHVRDTEIYLRDLHVYSDGFPQPYLVETVRQHGIEQRLLAVLAAYHWSDDEARAGRSGTQAKGRFVLVHRDGSSTPVLMSGQPTVRENGSTLRVSVPLAASDRLEVIFRERDAAFRLLSANTALRLGLLFEWSPALTAFAELHADTLRYRFRNFAYAVPVLGATTETLATGVSIVAAQRRGFRLQLAQSNGATRAGTQSG